jgi:hypothetical protein
MSRLKQQIRLFGAAMVAAIALTACGGGGGAAGTGSSTTTPGPSSAAQGLWKGTAGTAPNDRTLTNLVFGDGSYYLIYSAAGVPNSIAGVIQGTGAVSGAKFTSSNTKDFDFEGSAVSDATLSVDFTTKNSFNGSIVYAGGTSSFTSNYSTAFETKPTLAAITGTFSGNIAPVIGAAQAATLTVSAAGALTGDASGCALSGSISPRNDGNAYNVSLKFGASPCMFANQTLSGLAYFDAATSTISVVAPNAGRSDGVVFMGTGTGLGSGTGTGSFDPALVGIWTKSNQTLTFNADGTYSNNVIISGCGTYGVTYTESIDYGTFSTSGSSLTYVKSSGSVKSWSCSSMAAYPANPTSSSTSGAGFVSTVTYSFSAGTGFGQQLIQDGTNILTRQ